MGPRVGSLFTGIGGLDLGLERAGWDIAWQAEVDRHACRILERHWPAVPNLGDVRTVDWPAVEAVDLVCGGDPCPSRSRARGDRPSRHADLSGYFLAVVGRLRPRWVVRENVPAPDAVDFALCLAAFGYGVASVAFDSRDFTGQSRRRQFVIGCPPGLTSRFERAVSDASDGDRFGASGSSEETPVAACLTAHPLRLAAEDTYCFEPGRGLRLLDPREEEGLQGFPRDWTAGLARGRRRTVLGNAVTVDVAQWIGKQLLAVVRQGVR